MKMFRYKNDFLFIRCIIYKLQCNTISQLSKLTEPKQTSKADFLMTSTIHLDLSTLTADKFENAKSPAAETLERFNHVIIATS